MDDIEEFGVIASDPDQAFKETIFKQYISIPNTLNPKKLEASAKHFYNFSDR